MATVRKQIRFPPTALRLIETMATREGVSLSQFTATGALVYALLVYIRAGGPATGELADLFHAAKAYIAASPIDNP